MASAALMMHASDDEDPGVNSGLGMEMLINKKRISGSNGYNSNVASDDGGGGGESYGGGRPNVILASRGGSGRNSSHNGDGDDDDETMFDDGDGGGSAQDDGSIQGGGSEDLSRRGGGGPITQEELLNAKREILYQLGRLEKKGIRVPKVFNMSSNYEEMKAEYERLKRDVEVDASVRFQRRMLMACVSGVEFLNNRFDPLEVYLDGWSESVQDSINDYDDIFEELHDKYRGKMKMAPELRLMFTLGGSAVWFHMTHSMFKASSMPGIEQVFSQNPELKRQFMQAAMNSATGSVGGNANSSVGGGGRGGGGGGGGGGGIFGSLGNLANGFFGGRSTRNTPGGSGAGAGAGGGGAGAGGRASPSPPPPSTPGGHHRGHTRRNMQGPSGVDEILMEINDETFGHGKDDMNGNDISNDPSRLFEIFSNSGGGETEDMDGDTGGSTGSQYSSEAEGPVGRGQGRTRQNRVRRGGNGGGSIQRRRTLTLD